MQEGNLYEQQVEAAYKDEQLNNVHGALLGSVMQGGPVALVLHHNQLLASSVQQRSHHIHMTHLSSKVQGCLAGLGSAAHIGLVLDQHLYQGQPACTTHQQQTVSDRCWLVGCARGAPCQLEISTLLAVCS